MLKKLSITSFIIFIFSCHLFAIENPSLEKSKTSFIQEPIVKPFSYDNEKYRWIGGHFTSVSLLGFGSRMGIGLSGMYSSDGERGAYFTDMSFYIPGNSSSTEYVNSFSSQTDPHQKLVDVNYKISGFGLRMGYRRYFKEDVIEDGFKFYAHAFIGLQVFKVDITSSDFDPSLYYPNYEPEYIASGLIFGGGLGAEYSMGSKLNLFGDFNLNVPANTIGGEAIDVEIPPSAQLVFGTKFYF
ncbi:MAG: hypothetical protein ACKVQB_07440 [Bacteroidia bacterium]